MKSFIAPMFFGASLRRLLLGSVTCSVLLLFFFPSATKAQEADSYFASLTVTPNAFVAGGNVRIRAVMKQFSSFLYQALYWQGSLDGRNWQTLGRAQQEGEFSLAYSFDFIGIPSTQFYLRAAVVTESFIASGATTTEYSSPSLIQPLSANSPGVLGFGVASGAISEGIGTATVVVSRTGGISGAVSVVYTLHSGTAIAGQDFAAATGTLAFAENESSKTFTISIIDDLFNEGDETFTVVLSSPTGGATLGEITTLTVTIQNNDFGPPPVQVGATVGPMGGGTVTGAGTFNAGSSVTLTATANPGFEFVSWTEGETVVSTNSTYTFVAGNSRNLVANFRASVAAQPARLGLPQKLRNGTVEFSVAGTVGKRYRVLRSSDMRSWELLTTVTLDVNTRVSDERAEGAARFYIAVAE